MQTFTSDSLKALFAYPFQDPNWKTKLLIGSGLTLAGFIIPLIPFFFIYGYMGQIMRAIIVEDREPFLPEWDDWGKLFLDGLKLLGSVFVLIFPLIALFMVGYVIFFLMLAMSGVVVTGAESSGQDPSILAAIFPVLGGVALFVTYGLVLVISLALGVLMPVIMGHVVATDDFMAVFRVKEWWAIFRANLRGFVLGYLVLLLISAGTSLGMTVIYATIILCCLIPFIIGPVMMYTLLIYGAIFGQSYREGVQQLAAQSSA